MSKHSLTLGDIEGFTVDDYSDIEPEPKWTPWGIRLVSFGTEPNGGGYAFFELVNSKTELARMLHLRGFGSLPRAYHSHQGRYKTLEHHAKFSPLRTKRPVDFDDFEGCPAQLRSRTNDYFRDLCIKGIGWTDFKGRRRYPDQHRGYRTYSISGLLTLM